MSKWDGINRRKFPRIFYPCLVVIKNDDGKDGDVLLTHTENVGVGGVCVILKQNVKMFSSVELELDLMDLENHIKCKGKVVWNVRRRIEEPKKPLFYDIGIEFDGLSSSEQQRLKQVVGRLAQANEKSPQKS